MADVKYKKGNRLLLPFRVMAAAAFALMTGTAVQSYLQTAGPFSVSAACGGSCSGTFNCPTGCRTCSNSVCAVSS